MTPPSPAPIQRSPKVRMCRFGHEARVGQPCISCVVRRVRAWRLRHPAAVAAQQERQNTARRAKTSWGEIP